MPIELVRNSRYSSKLAVWHITEPSSYFTAKLALSHKEKAAIGELILKRQMERLVAYYLVNLLLQTRSSEIHKTSSGKPYIKDKDVEISISHSGAFVAVIISTNPTGVDIQVYTKKIHKITRRFLRKDEELLFKNIPELHRYHLIWSCKETVYKIYAHKQLDFVKHIQITEDTNTLSNNVIAITINTQGESQYILKYELHDQYILVYGH